MRISSVVLFSLMGMGLVTLSACDEVKPPRDEGVCYFIGHVGKDKNGHDKLKFNEVRRNVPDLEHCAVEIYNVRRGFMTTGTAGPVTEGVYQGTFLFAANGEVRMATKYDGPQFPFLVVAGNQLVSPSAAHVDDTQTDGGKPETIVVPKDLPKAPAAAPAAPAK